MWSEGVKLEVRYRWCMGTGWSVREGRGFPTEGTIYNIEIPEDRKQQVGRTESR